MRVRVLARLSRRTVKERNRDAGVSGDRQSSGFGKEAIQQRQASESRVVVAKENRHSAPAIAGAGLRV